MGNELRPDRMAKSVAKCAKKTANTTHKGIKKTANATHKGVKKTVKSTTHVVKKTAKVASRPDKVAKSVAEATQKGAKGLANAGINGVKSTAQIGFHVVTDPTSAAESITNTTKSVANTTKSLGKSVSNSAVNGAKALPGKGIDIVKHPQNALDIVDNIYRSAPVPMTNPADIFRAAQGDMDALERIGGIDKINENVDLYCDIAENPTTLEDIKEADVGLIHIDENGMEAKPQWKCGVGGDNFYAGGGLDDIRDGFSFSVGASIFVKIHLEGNTFSGVIKNMKCKAKSKKGSDRLLSAFKKPAQLVHDLLNTLGVNIELTGVWFDIYVVISKGVGFSASCNGGWTDTNGYKMVGVGGKLAVGLELGASVFAGFHKTGKSIKVKIGFSNVAFTMVVKLDRKEKSNEKWDEKSHEKSDEKSIIINVNKSIIVTYHPSQICLISLKGTHGKWLCAESSGKASVSSQCKKWEQFWSIPLGHNQIGLLSHHKKYMSAQENGMLQANRGRLLQWETFTVVQKCGCFAFKSCHDKFLSAKENGAIKINADKVNDWELFEVDVIKVAENKILPDGNYKFLSIHSGKSLAVSATCNIIQWDSHNRKDQIFSIQRQKSGHYTIKCLNSGLYWDIRGAKNDKGAKLIQYNYHGNDNQLFEICLQCDNKWYIKAKHSGKVLGISGNTKKNGANIHQWDAHFGDNQLFYCRIQK